MNPLIQFWPPLPCAFHGSILPIHCSPSPLSVHTIFMRHSSEFQQPVGYRHVHFHMSFSNGYGITRQGFAELHPVGIYYHRLILRAHEKHLTIVCCQIITARAGQQGLSCEGYASGVLKTRAVVGMSSVHLMTCVATMAAPPAAWTSDLNCSTGQQDSDAMPKG